MENLKNTKERHLFPKGGIIDKVYPDTPGFKAGIKPGDKVIEIDGQPIRDIIDYQYNTYKERLTLAINPSEAPDEIIYIDLKKQPEELLGLKFASPCFDKIKRCTNKCIFCFVDQLPSGMRGSLYEKDDDYRLSFLYGNFVTLTNLTKNDRERIIDQSLSPLFISVHATDPDVRENMLQHPKARYILDELKILSNAGISFHTQIVLIPGVNDGVVLEQTLDDLATFWPYISSIGIVPVGLTKYREGLNDINPFTKEQAEQTLFIIDRYSREFKLKFGYRLVFAADELYQLSGESIPKSETYEDFPQLENGIGIMRLFLDELNDITFPKSIQSKKEITIATGKAGEKILGEAVKRLNRIKGLKANLKVIKSKFFGDNITVSGLITGKDIIKALENEKLGDILIIPGFALKERDTVFLDEVKITDIQNILRVHVETAQSPGDICEILNHLEDETDESR